MFVYLVLPRVSFKKAQNPRSFTWNIFFRSKIRFVKKEVCAGRPIPDNRMMEGVPLVVQNGQGSGVQFEGRPVGALPPLRSLLTLSLPVGGWEPSIFYLFSSLESSLPPEPILGLPSSQFSWACRRWFTDTPRPPPTTPCCKEWRVGENGPFRFYHK